MRVLVGIPCLLTGGTEIQTLSLVEALVAAGHRVSVVCYFEYSDEMVRRYEEAGACVYLIHNSQFIIHNSLIHNSQCIIHNELEDEVADGLADGDRRGRLSSYLGGSRPKGIVETVRVLWRGLRRVVRAVRPDVAHVQYMAPGAIPIVMLRMLGVPKVVATAHTAADIYSPRGLRLVQALNRRLLDAFQCITLRAEESFFGSASLLGAETRFGRRGVHFTVYNNVPGYIEVKDSGDEPPRGTLTVGVVSRLEGIKGMDLVVPAVASLIHNSQFIIHNELADGVVAGDRRGACRPSSDGLSAATGGVACRPTLLVVGDGSLRGEMERQAREAGIAERVEFVGRQPQAVLQAFYDRIDILLMPSRSEGFGLTAVEGMARGCVPLVANVGGLPEVVRDGVDGLLHEPESVESLAAQLRRLVEDDDLRARLRAGALRRARDFSRQAYGEKIKFFYEKLEQR